MNNYLEEKDLPKMYDELPFWSAPFGLKLLDFIDYKQNITAVDLGFGTGFPLLEMAMRLGEYSMIYGIDNWKEAFDIVNKKITYFSIKNVKLVEGNIEKIPLENLSISLITSNNCINNVENIDNAIMECYRILVKNGQIVLTMNLDKTMYEFYDIMEQTLLELSLKEFVDLMHQHIKMKRPSVDKIIGLMENNFIIKNVEYDQFKYKFSNGSAMLNHHFIKVAFMGAWKKILPENRVQEIFNIIEIKLNKKASELNGIKLSVPFVLINGYKN